MHAADLLAWARFTAYTAGWRHAPEVLRRIEIVGQRLRDRPLAIRRVTLASLAIELVGWDDAFAADLRALVAPHGRCESHGKTRLGDVLARPSDADLQLVETPQWHARAFVDAGFVVAPKRVAHVEHVSSPDNDYAARVRRDVERAELRAEVTRDVDALERFHRTMYLPTMRARHTSHARPTPLPILRTLLREGALLEVRDRTGKQVSGALVAPSPLDRATLQIVVVGVVDGDYQGTTDAMRLAPILFARDHARSSGVSRIDHLVTRPFPGDGLFQRKARWGAHVEDLPHRPDRLAVRVLRRSPALTKLLEDHPVLAFDAVDDARLTPTVLR